jgi:hypothetical protein
MTPMEPAPTLAAAASAGASAYLVTVTPDGRPHVAPASVVVRDRRNVVVSGPGRRTRANVEADSTVTVLWSPAEDDGYALIVDGTAVVHDDGLVVCPTRAVLHRPARGQGARADAGPGDGCAADCVEIALE